LVLVLVLEYPYGLLALVLGGIGERLLGRDEARLSPAYESKRDEEEGAPRGSRWWRVEEKLYTIHSPVSIE
jgi:hypothetical protein